MKKYFLFFFALFAYNAASAQKGEIIYTDFEPDLFVQYYAWQGPGHVNAPVELDINHDSTIDLRFTCEDAWGHWVDCVLRKSDDGWQFKLPYLLYQEDAAAPVGDTVNFGDNIAEIGNGWTSAYRFWWTFSSYEPIYPDYTNEHHYICVRREVEEGYCYGWIDSNILLVVGDNVFTDYEFDVTVFRMAYCTIPNYPLRVGQIDFTDGIDETRAFATVYPNHRPRHHQRNGSKTSRSAQHARAARGRRHGRGRDAASGPQRPAGGRLLRQRHRQRRAQVREKGGEGIMKNTNIRVLLKIDKILIIKQ